MSKQTERIKDICKQLDQYKVELYQILIDKKSGVNICHKPLREYIHIIIQVNLRV